MAIIQNTDQMIELTYFHPLEAHIVYQVIQFREQEPWKVVVDGELLGSIKKLDGTWCNTGNLVLDEQLTKAIGALIDQQNFQRLPMEIKKHWTEYVQEALAQGDNEYLIICRPEVDFNRFEKVFRTYILELVKDSWEIRFRVYDASMSNDFEVFVKHKQLI
jgi:hypothetical protein